MDKVFLPGTPGQRISDLRARAHMNQTELAKKLDISKSTLSRIESGETESVSSDIVMKLTKLFGVSADFILGISDDPAKSEATGLGLPEKAVKVISEGNVDMNALGSMLSADSFPYVSRCIGQYLDGSLTNGITAHNDIVNEAMNMLSGNPSAQQDISQIKIPQNEEKRQLMLRIQQLLAEMKKDYGHDNDTAADSAMVKRIMREAEAERRKKSQVTPDAITDIVLRNVSRACKTDMGMFESFRSPITELLKNVGGKRI